MIEDRIAELRARRQQYEENYRTFQLATFKFNTGLKMVTRKLVQTAENFYALTGGTQAAFRKAS